MADSPLETYCDPQDIGAVNEYPLWREPPDTVLAQNHSRVAGWRGVAKSKQWIILPRTPSKNPRPLQDASIYCFHPC